MKIQTNLIKINNYKPHFYSTNWSQLNSKNKINLKKYLVASRSAVTRRDTIFEKKQHIVEKSRCLLFDRENRREERRAMIDRWRICCPHLYCRLFSNYSDHIIYLSVSFIFLIWIKSMINRIYGGQLKWEKSAATSNCAMNHRFLSL